MTVMEITDLLDEVGSTNLTIFDGLVKANSVINNPRYNTIICSISGGSDSDIVLDICHKIDKDKKIIYVWFDTGLEYQATKDHLKFLEKKYQIEIHREKAIKPIPTSNRLYGEPFLNKFVSEQIMRLQKHNFKWEDDPFDILVTKYPKCRSALKWWCNQYTKEYIERGTFKEGGNCSRFDIRYNKWLKEFMLQNPPTFKVANKCCTYAKKNVSKELIKRYKADLMIIGVRRAEGGIRASSYKNCFSNNKAIGGDCDQYRPIFYYNNSDKEEYEKIFGVTHSNCYTQYGMIRTGCAGCPFNRNLAEEMSVIEMFEPKLYKGINNIFKDSYEYTKQYREFYAKKQAAEKPQGQISWSDYFKEF